jgi:hypothetical protein
VDVGCDRGKPKWGKNWTTESLKNPEIWDKVNKGKWTESKDAADCGKGNPPGIYVEWSGDAHEDRKGAGVGGTIGSVAGGFVGKNTIIGIGIGISVGGFVGRYVGPRIWSSKSDWEFTVRVKVCCCDKLDVNKFGEATVTVTVDVPIHKLETTNDGYRQRFTQNTGDGMGALLGDWKGSPYLE